jgi:hypothetical protein
MDRLKGLEAQLEQLATRMGRQESLTVAVQEENKQIKAQLDHLQGLRERELKLLEAKETFLDFVRPQLERHQTVLNVVLVRHVMVDVGDLLRHIRDAKETKKKRPLSPHPEQMFRNAKGGAWK